MSGHAAGMAAEQASCKAQRRIGSPKSPRCETRGLGRLKTSGGAQCVCVLCDTDLLVCTESKCLHLCTVVKVQKAECTVQTNERSLARSDRARGEKERSVIRIMFLIWLILTSAPGVRESRVRPSASAAAVLVR